MEFALIAPIFFMLLVATIDFGGMLYTKFNLDGAVNAAGNYAVVNASSVNALVGPSLATSLASIAGSGHASGWANATVVVNNGPTATMTAGVVTSSGTAANASLCYCPTRGSLGITWGAATTCGTICASGGIAGKFVSIAASRIYNPIFATYGLVKSGAISASTVVETQ